MSSQFGGKSSGEIELTLSNTLAGTLSDSSAEALTTGASLLIYHRNGSQLVPIAEGTPLVIGRSRPADVPIRDPSLSRAHARFSLRNGQLWAEDLGSTNGTRVDGKKIERQHVREGQEILLGSVVVVFHALAPPAYRGLASYDRFCEALELEVARCRAFKRPLALLMVRAPRKDIGKLSRWAPRVKAQLRDVDIMAVYDTNSALILCLESELEQGQKQAEAIIEGKRKDEPPLVCGVVAFPSSGPTAAQLIEEVRRAARQATPRKAVYVVKVGEPELELPDKPIFASKAMLEVEETVKRVARAEIPVLITGETGTGKEVVAHLIHRHSARKRKAFRALNCAALPESLLESALFGHEKGAFTGATHQAKGLFEEADGGTVFLDEIGELSAAAQASLLRVLETKQLSRVGSAKDQPVDVRILAATHRDLEQMCREGRFRQDLLFRLNTMVIPLPPLRERREEIEPLCHRFIAMAKKANRCNVKSIDPRALELVLHYDWPGNVRELRNAIERAVVIAQDEVITASDLPSSIRQQSTASDAGDDGGGQALDGDDADLPIKERMQRYEAQLLLQALEHHDWNQTKTAEALGISLRSLVYKIKAYSLKKRYVRE